MSKWFSMEVFPRPVTKRNRSMPASVSSSTTYCTTGRRPTGSISLGCDLVAGSRRVPRPATGTTALVMSSKGSPGRSTVPYIISAARRLAAPSVSITGGTPCARPHVRFQIRNPPSVPS